jgi:hypothetical protein
MWKCSLEIERSFAYVALACGFMPQRTSPGFERSVMMLPQRWRWPVRVASLVSMAVLSLLLIIPAPSSVTKESYLKINLGMSRADVQTILRREPDFCLQVGGNGAQAGTACCWADTIEDVQTPFGAGQLGKGNVIVVGFDRTDRVDEPPQFWHTDLNRVDRLRMWWRAFVR